MSPLWWLHQEKTFKNSVLIWATLKSLRVIQGPVFLYTLFKITQINFNSRSQGLLHLGLLYHFFVASEAHSPKLPACFLVTAFWNKGRSSSTNNNKSYSKIHHSHHHSLNRRVLYSSWLILLLLSYCLIKVLLHWFHSYHLYLYYY